MQFFDKFHNPKAGYDLLRVTLAMLMILHGIFKVMNGTAGVEGMLANAGLPAFLAYGVYLGELVAPIFLLAGVFVAPAALVIAVNMLFALGLAHGAQILQLNPKTGGWQIELQAFFLLTAVVVAMLAPKSKTAP